MARARDGKAFADSEHGMAWEELWCRDCVHYVPGCPLLSTAMLGRTPAPWTERDPEGLNRYTCREHQDIDIDQSGELS